MTILFYAESNQCLVPIILALYHLQAGTEDGCVTLFHVTDEGVEYNKSLNKQEGM